MKQMLLAITCILLLNVSCKKEEEDGPKYPTAQFKIYDGGFEGSREITFENTSKNAIQCIWDFGQGGGIEPQGPDILKKKWYNKEGTYTVILKAYGYGYESTYSQQIVVKGK